MKPIQILMMVVMTGLTGCASQGALDSTRNDVDEVRGRLFSLEKKLGGVRSESREGIDAIEKSLKTDVAEVRKLSADIQATIDSTKTEMQAMNGKLDDMNISLKKPTEDLARYREDADKRIIALEDRIIIGVAALTPTTIGMLHALQPAFGLLEPRLVHVELQRPQATQRLPRAVDIIDTPAPIP